MAAVRERTTGERTRYDRRMQSSRSVQRNSRTQNTRAAQRNRRTQNTGAAQNNGRTQNTRAAQSNRRTQNARAAQGDRRVQNARAAQNGRRVQNSRTMQGNGRMQNGRSVQGNERMQSRRSAQDRRTVQDNGRAQRNRNMQNGRSVQSSGYTQRNAYVYGSAVRKLDVAREIERAPRRKLSNAARKNREKAEHMNPGYVFFLSLALIATGWILVSYISLQSDITNSIHHISDLESQLNDLRLSNDEEYNRITSSIDLEEVRRIAIQELGMKYAEEGQIVSFASENSDYVKQISSIPD